MAAALGPLREARALAGAARVVRRTAAVRRRSGHVPGVEQSGGIDDGPGWVRDMVVALDQRVRGLWFGGAACRSQAAAFEVWTFLTVTPAITSVRLDELV